MSATTATSAVKQKIVNLSRRYKGSLDEDQRPLFRAFGNETLPRLRAPFLAHHPAKAVLSYL